MRLAEPIGVELRFLVLWLLSGNFNRVLPHVALRQGVKDCLRVLFCAAYKIWLPLPVEAGAILP